MALSKRKEGVRFPCGNIQVNKGPQRERGTMTLGVGEPRSPTAAAASCAARLFDALKLKPCDLELARALYVAGHASHAAGGGLGESDLMGQLAETDHDRADLWIEPIGNAAGNFVVSLQRRCHRILELARIDIYRIAGGKIAEHWHVLQPAAVVLARTVASPRPPISLIQANQKHPGQPDMRRV
jgi:hypothetical protein